MKKETLLEVVSELVGYTEPCGDEGIDQIRYENQEKIIELVKNGVEDLIRNSKHRSYLEEDSTSRIGNRAYESLTGILKLLIENYTNMVDQERITK